MKITKFQMPARRLPGLIRYGVPSSIRNNKTLARAFIKDVREQKEAAFNKYSAIYDNMTSSAHKSIDKIKIVDLSPETVFLASTIPGKWNPYEYGKFYPELKEKMEPQRKMLYDWFNSDAYMFGLSQAYPNLPKDFLFKRFVKPQLDNLSKVELNAVGGGTMWKDYRVKTDKAHSITKEPPYWMSVGAFYAPGTQHLFVPTNKASDNSPIVAHEITHSTDLGQGFGNQFLYNAAKDPADLWHHNLNTEMRAYTIPAQAWIYQQTGLNPLKSWHWPKIQEFLDSQTEYSPWTMLLQNYKPEALKYQMTHGLKHGGVLKRI